MKCPKNCRDRSPTCHIDCEDYIEYRKKNEQAKKERHKELAVVVYQCDQKMRYIRDKRNHQLFKKEIKDK